MYGDSRAITLIALIVTIIILIILAGVSINLLFGKNGLINHARNGEEEYTREQIEEQITIMIADYAIESKIENKTLLEYMQEKKDNKKIDEVTDNADGTITVELRGYSVVIDVKQLSIISVDKGENIVKIKLSTTIAKLNEKIIATVTFSEEIDSNKCRWVYNKEPQEGIEEARYINTFTSLENTIELTATQEGVYYLHVLVVDKEGNKTQKVSSAIKVGNYVTSITLDKTELSIEEGKEEIITAIVEPDDATNKAIEWTSSDESIATVDETGKITAEKVGKVTITATAKDESGTKATCSVEVIEKQPVDVSTIEKGVFIEYDVEYTDTYYPYEYTITNGWRLLNYKTREDGKTLYDVELISTGIPARMYYYCTDTTNNYSNWIKDTTNLNKFKNVLGSDYGYYTGSGTYYALQASAGYYYNLGVMTFKQGTVYDEPNMGYYTKIKNGSIEYTTGAKMGNDLFKTEEDVAIRIMTFPELCDAVGRTNDFQNFTSFNDDTGLYQLSSLKNKLEGRSYVSSGNGMAWWLASPVWETNDDDDGRYYVEAVSFSSRVAGYRQRKLLWCTTYNFLTI